VFDDALPEPHTQELPLPDYPHLTTRAIESRVADLDRAQVEALLRYECAHRERTPVIRLLTARLRRLRETAPRKSPPGGSTAPVPEQKPYPEVPGIPARRIPLGPWHRPQP
jgi:hypothetical protein